MTRAAPASAPTITVSDLVGVYEGHAESEQPEFSGASRAVVSLDDGGGLRLRLDFAASVILVSGTLVGDGHLVLEGSGTIGADPAFDVLGTGIASLERGGIWHITGSVNGSALRENASPTIFFVLERVSTARR